jgi:Kelch motif
MCFIVTLAIAAATCPILANAASNVPVFKHGFSEVENYPLYVSEAQGGIYGDETAIFPGSFGSLVCGGFLDFPDVTSKCYSRTMFRSRADSNWTYETDLPEPLTHMAVTALGNRMFFCGGFRGAHPGKSVDRCFYYNKGSKVWRSLPRLPGNRAGGGLVLLDSSNTTARLFYAGGVDRVDNSNKLLIDYGSAWEIEVPLDDGGGARNATWKQRADLPNPRNHMGAATAVCANGTRRHFYIGGQHREMEGNGNQASVSEYDPNSASWVERKPLPTALGHISASVVGYGCGVFVVGGVQNSEDGGDMSSAVWWYDATVNNWTKVGSLPLAAKTPVCDIRWSHMVCVTGGKTFMAWIGFV